MIPLERLTGLAVRAAREAGALIASYRDRAVTAEHKQGGDTPASQVVTEVDRAAEDRILQLLGPSCEEFGLGLLSEEREDDRGRLERDAFWCIDPLDGTLPFVEGRPGYSVSIALVARDGSPQLGVVYDPVEDILYQATRGLGLQRNGRPWTPANTGTALCFTYDRSLVDHPRYAEVLQFLEELAGKLELDGLEATQRGGSVMNACRVLDTAPGCHFKFPKSAKGGGSLWDYAATACLFEEAGMVVSDMHGDRLELNRAESTFMNHRGALYASSEDIASAIRALLG